MVPFSKSQKTNCEKFKQSVLYDGAVPVISNIYSYITFRNTQKNIMLVIDLLTLFNTISV